MHIVIMTCFKKSQHDTDEPAGDRLEVAEDRMRSNEIE